MMEATDFAAAISRTETARFYPSELCNSHSRRIRVRLSLDFPRRSPDCRCRPHLRLDYSRFNTAEVPKCVSSFCGRSLWSSHYRRFQRALVVAEEIGEGPEFT